MSRILPIPAGLPALPLLLWKTPPGLELILSQEGIAFEKVDDPFPTAFGAGRFVLYDRRHREGWQVRNLLTSHHVAIDVDTLRAGERPDPFAALIDTKPGIASWNVAGHRLKERVARWPKAPIRRRLLGRLRELVLQAGGVWARLAPYPYPYRSAFHFRADLDEYEPEDYARFARARKPLDDCATHFISTHAYGGDSAILDDLRQLDAQSHGHFHVVYRDESANRRNLERAHEILEGTGIHPEGFAAPEGRWNPGLDRALEELGYRYSSDFQLNYDDFPFFPRRDGRFSRVLQIPVHPVCEGLFQLAGLNSGRVVGEYLAAVVRSRIASGEPAFVYGHPERRLARMPEVFAILSKALAGEGLLWRTTMTAFADWWLWRQGRRWSLVPQGSGRFELRILDWNPRYPMVLEVCRGSHVAAIPIRGPRMTVQPSALVFERRRPRIDGPTPAAVRPSRSLKALLRTAIDWETVTPIDELPDATLADRLKKQLRRWRGGSRTVQEG